jgi:hypothetical protein
LAEAPLLFVSSNPGAGSDSSPDGQELNAEASDDELLSYEDGAFDDDQRPGIEDGEYPRDRHGRRGKPVPYWHWVKACANDLLDRDPIPGRDYALTEVVHCGSLAEFGVQSALRTCVTRYLLPVLAASPSVVVVVVGAVARDAFKQYLGLDMATHFLGPLDLAGKRRLLVVVAHPSSFGGNKPLGAHLTPEELVQVRQAMVQ